MASSPVSLPFDYRFRHPTWVDTVDRVAAGGPGGFNALFKVLEEDMVLVKNLFTTAADTLNTLQAKVDTLGQPRVVHRSVTLMPALVPYGGQPGWDATTLGSAVKPSGAGSAQGMMTVPLPDGSTITGFQAAGSNVGSGQLTLEVHCRRLDGTNERVVARISVPGLPTGGTFPASPVAVIGDGRVTEGTVCWVTAKVAGGQVTDTVSLSGFQVLYDSI